MIRYFSTQRPVSPGTYPKPDGNPAKLIHNFGSRKFITNIGKEAWGYVEYEKPLTEKDAANYELVQEVDNEKRLAVLLANSIGMYADQHYNNYSSGKEFWKMYLGDLGTDMAELLSLGVDISGYVEDGNG